MLKLIVMKLKMFFEPQFIYWFLIPTIFALFIFIKSIFILSRRKSIFNWIITSIIFLLIAFSEYILFLIFFLGYYPTSVPHMIIGLATVIFLLQFFINKDKNKSERKVARVGIWFGLSIKKKLTTL